VMGKHRPPSRAGCRILLVAIAIQGLTPDHASLASTWLLRCITLGSPGHWAADDGAAPMPTPIHGGDHDVVPGESCSNVAAESSLRVRFDTGGRLCIHVIPISLLERPNRSDFRSPCPIGVVRWGSDGLIRSLCRFLC
jgi:hypothetical protein